MRVYFVTTGLQEELEVIKQLRPPALLCSYWYFKNRPLAQLIEQIGYRPEILLDSGAYTAHTKGKNISLLDYLGYIERNAQELSGYISLDVIGDDFITRSYYSIMRGKGFEPIAVYHYGESLETLSFYIEHGAKTIALGNTVPIRDKAKVATWCQSLRDQFPGIHFHLLGSSCSRVLQCGALESCDSSAWYMQAVNGRPKDIPGKTKQAKIDRALFNMRKIMEENNDNYFLYSLNSDG